MASATVMTASGGEGDGMVKESLKKEGNEYEPKSLQNEASVDDGLAHESEEHADAPKETEDTQMTENEATGRRTRGMTDTLRRLRSRIHRPQWGSHRSERKCHGKLMEDDIPADIETEAANAVAAATEDAFDEETPKDGFQRPMRTRVTSQITGFFRRIFLCNDVRASSSEMDLAGTHHIPTDAVVLTSVSNENAVLPRRSEGDEAEPSEHKDGGDSPMKKAMTTE